MVPKRTKVHRVYVSELHKSDIDPPVFYEHGSVHTIRDWVFKLDDVRPVPPEITTEGGFFNTEVFKWADDYGVDGCVLVLFPKPERVQLQGLMFIGFICWAWNISDTLSR